MRRPQFECTVFDAAVAAGRSRTAADLAAALESAFAMLGFDYFRVVEAVADGNARVLRFLMGKVHTAWETAYDEARRARHDPRLRWALISSEPFFLSEVMAAPGVRDDERALVEQAARFGIAESFVLSHRGHDNREFAVILIGPGRPIDGIYRVAAHTLSSALLFGALRIDAAPIGRADKFDRRGLTIRQLQCLEWSRRGKSSSDTRPDPGPFSPHG